MPSAISAALVAAIQAASPSPAPVFAPPVGVPLVMTIEQRRQDGDAPARTTIAHRRIVFHRDGAGWQADMTHAGASVDAAGDAFARALAAVMAQPVVFRLDAGGRIVSVDALDAFWARFVAAMRTTIGDRAAAPLEAMPQSARLPFVASLLRDAIEAEAAGEGPQPAEPIDLPAAPHAGGGPAALLPGTRSVERRGDRLHISIDAAGPLAAPAGSSATIVRKIALDPTTGLLAERRDHVETRLSDGAVAHVRTTVMAIGYSDTRRETPAKP